VTERIGALARSALIYGTGDVLTKLISFLLLPLFTAYLTPDDYGVASILNLVAFVLSSVFSLGLGTAIGVIYFKGDAADMRPKTIWTAALLLALSATVMVTLSALFAGRISEIVLRSPIYADLLVIVISGTGFSILTLPFSLYYQFEQKPVQYTALSVLSALLSVSLNVIAVVVLRLGLFGWLGAMLIGQGLTLLLYALPVMLRVRFAAHGKTTLELLRNGIPLVPSFMFLFVLQQSNRLFLERFSGVDTVGIYAVGSNLGMIINLIVSGFTRAWVPYALSYVEKQEEARALFGRITSYYLIGGGALTLCCFVFARPVVLIMTAPAYHEAYIVIGLVAATQYLTGLFSVLLPAIYFAQDVRYLVPIQFGAAFVTVIACLLAIPPLGAFGAALAMTLGTLAMCAFTHLWNVRHRNYFHPTYETRRIVRFAAFFVIVAFVYLTPRSFAIPVELVLSLFGAAVTVGFTYFLLYDTEKRLIVTALQGAAHRLRFGMSR
jgi:O-antigen/teichoic acid export membrane protein